MVEPVKGQSLTPGRNRVKRGSRSARSSAPGAIVPLKKTRVAEAIADRIRELILDRTFAAGLPLPGERDLAERFGVSRGSVRDALRTLETIGLIETRHGQGTFPKELDVNRLVAPLASVLTYSHDLQEELLDVRRMFEPAVARVAAARATADDLGELEHLIHAQRQKLKTGRTAIVEDTAFHAVLARATGNRVIVRLMETLNDLLVESRKLTLKQKGRPARSLRGHEHVVAAVRAHDGDAASRAMLNHIDQIADLLHQPNAD